MFCRAGTILPQPLLVPSPSEDAPASAIGKEHTSPLHALHDTMIF
jgi:hypothetical protein